MKTKIRIYNNYINNNNYFKNKNLIIKLYIYLK